MAITARPLGKTGAHLEIFLKTVAQSVQTFGDFLPRMAGQGLCAFVNLMPGMIPASMMTFNEGSPIFFLLADCLVIEDRATDAFTETGCGHNQLSIGSPGLLGQGNSQIGKSFVAGRLLSCHREKAFVTGGQPSRNINKLRRIHW